MNADSHASPKRKRGKPHRVTVRRPVPMQARSASEGNRVFGGVWGRGKIFLPLAIRLIAPAAGRAYKEDSEAGGS